MAKKIIAADKSLELTRPFLEKKSSLSYSNCTSFAGYLYDNGYYDLHAYQAIKYYIICAPVYTGIDWIATEGSRIEPLIYDNKNKQFVDDANLKILSLLKYPNSGCIYANFAYKFIAYYLITGNTFIIATGDVNKPPKELLIVSPQYINFVNGNDGFPTTITYQTGSVSITFYRAEDDTRIRYYNKDKNLELWQSKSFNPLRDGFSNYWGLSILSSVFYDIEQYINTGIHNLSILQKGGRPSGLVISESNLSDAQYQRLQEQVNKFYSGPDNAGHIGVLEGTFEYKEMAKSAKDMDFFNLKRDAAERIYNVLRIPLPLVSTSTMTMANVENSKLNLYDNAVLPMIDKVMAELTLLLMPRFTKDKNLSVFYDVGSILAIAPRRNDELEKYSKMNIFTINELRALIGYEAVEGGDDIYQSSTDIPVARDTQEENPAISRDLKEDVRIRFINIMQSQLDENGDRRYTDRETLELADRNGL